MNFFANPIRPLKKGINAKISLSIALHAKSWILPSTLHGTLDSFLNHDSTNALCPKGAVSGHLVSIEDLETK